MKKYYKTDALLSPMRFLREAANGIIGMDIKSSHKHLKKQAYLKDSTLHR
jgi:hypothetical protein